MERIHEEYILSIPYFPLIVKNYTHRGKFPLHHRKDAHL